MIADLKPYPEYKESTLPWVKQIPKHWNVVRNGSLFGQRNETGYADLPILEVSLNTGVRVRNFEASTRKQVMSDAGKYKRAVKGEVAYNMMRLWQGAVGVSPVDGLVSPAYVVARPYVNVEPEYYVRLFRTAAYMAEIDNRSRGIVKDRNRLYWDQFKQIRSPYPPPEEQAAIVRFLNWTHARMEKAVGSKRRVIALLKEQKRAIIHEAVTGGVETPVRRKPSGSPWFGDIPRHWQIHQARHIGRLLKGSGGTKEDAVDEGVPCVRYGELYTTYNNFIWQSRTFISPERAVDYTPIRYGDVLFAASGEKIEEIGKSAVNLIASPAVCGGDLVILRPSIPVHAPFLGYLFDSYGATYQKATMCRGTTIKHIYPDELRGLQVCFPPLDEQERIATALDGSLLQIHIAISHLEREIELLREFRTRLVADVVMGKLDVRDAALRVPDEELREVIAEDTDLMNGDNVEDVEAAA